MSASEILHKLKLDPAMAYCNKNNQVIYNIEDSNEFSRIFNRLDALDEFEQDFKRSSLTVDRSTIIFNGESCTVTLLGDYASNEYDLVIN